MKPTATTFIILCILLGTRGLAQTETLIPTSKLKEDLLILKKNLETVHAGLYTYTPKEIMDSTFLAFEKAVEDPMTERAFYRMILKLNNKIRNGHTMIIPPESVAEYIEKEALHIPFDVYEDGGRFYVLRNLSLDTSIQQGEEILEINEVPVKEIWDELIARFPKDGYSETYPSIILEQDFSEYYANVFESASSYLIKFQNDVGSTDREVKGLPISQMRKLAMERYGFDKRPWYNGITNPPFRFSIEEEVATFVLPTFQLGDIKDQKIKYKTFFQSAFEEIEQKQIEHLIIDLRGNGGGHADIGAELFSYLYDKPFELIRDMYSITRKLPNKQYYGGNNFGQGLQMKLALKKINQNKYAPRKFAAKMNHLTLAPREPAKIHYSGKTYVLMDGWCFSASAMFMALMKNYEIGTYIGQETGGSPYSQVGDFPQMLTLPNSGVRMLIPIFYEEMDVNFENDGRGVMPHHAIQNTIEQQINQEDAVMNWTLDFIKKNKINP